MPRTCTVCPHPHRDDIDRRLLDGAPLRNIAKQFSLSSASLFRHNKHISKVLSNARQEAEILRADGLMEQLNHLWTEAARLTAEGRAEEGPPDGAGRGEGKEPGFGTRDAPCGGEAAAAILRVRF